MHWTVDGANAIIALRCCKLSGRFVPVHKTFFSHVDKREGSAHSIVVPLTRPRDKRGRESYENH